VQRTTRWSLVVLVSGSLVGGAAWAEDKKPDKKIERLWKSKCSSCHGMDGKAQTDKGKQMKVADYSTAAWQKSRTDEQIKKGIEDGVKAEKDGVKQEMDGYKAELKADQIDGLVQFTRSLGPKP
jgi:mono/diheme cytochrome c family protein